MEQKKYAYAIVPRMCLNEEGVCKWYSLCPNKNCDKEEKEIKEPKDRCFVLEKELYQDGINPLNEFTVFDSDFMGEI